MGYHQVSDGRGQRLVYLNGELVTHVIWCDTDTGEVCYAPTPITHRAGQVVTRITKGDIKVEFINE